ncbi:MAG: hypothetical protein WBV40_14765, partial [Candidatus Cybelea sp.]
LSTPRGAQDGQAYAPPPSASPRGYCRGRDRRDRGCASGYGDKKTAANAQERASRGGRRTRERGPAKTEAGAQAKDRRDGGLSQEVLGNL